VRNLIVKPEEAVALLTSNPYEFLRFNALQIAGGVSLASGNRIFYLQRLGKTASFSTSGPDWTRTATVPFWRASVTSRADYRLPQRGDGRADMPEFRAFYVGMKQMGQEVATTHFALPSAGGPSIMLTSQLTGCTFGVGVQAPGGNCLASHLQPAGSGDGKRAPGALSEIGKKALKHAVSGPLGDGATILETTGETQISVVGFRDNGVWRFYKQVIDPLTQTITTRADTL
jgi:hypothetical protein